MARISSKELIEWQAYLLLEPTGFEIENWRFGYEMSVLHNINRDPEASEEFSPSDFMYDYNAMRDDNTTTKERDNKVEVRDNDVEVRDKPRDWDRNVVSRTKRMKQKSMMWVTLMGNK